MFLQPQARLQVAAQAQRSQSDGEVEEQQRGHEGGQQRDGRQALIGDTQRPAEVEEGAEEDGYAPQARRGSSDAAGGSALSARLRRRADRSSRSLIA